MSAVVLDTHVVQWLSAEPDRLSKRAREAIESSDALAVASITWYELGWLARNGRINVAIPIRSWLTELSTHLVTLEITPEVADTAVSLPASFPGDPADRVIYATAIEHGTNLVTKDQRMRSHRHPRQIAVW